MRQIITIFILGILATKVTAQQLTELNTYDSKKKTLVFLHPYMSSEIFFKDFSLENFKDTFNIIIVRAPYGEDGFYSWFSLDYNNNNWVNKKEAEETITKLHQALKKYDNIILIGYSQGGVIANSLGIFYPDKYKNIISMNSYMAPILLDDRIRNYKSSSFLFVYGENDFIVNEEMTKQSLEILKEKKIQVKEKVHNNYHSISREVLNYIKNYIQNGR